MTDYSQLHRLWLAMLLCPWDFPGKNPELAFPPPGDLPHPRTEPKSLALQVGSLSPSHWGINTDCCCASSPSYFILGITGHRS